MDGGREIFMKADELSWREVSDVLSENHQLRQQLNDLEQRNASQSREIVRLQEQVAALRQLYDRDQEVYDSLERQLVDIEGESQRISEQSLEFGCQNTYLASLYAASSCLHEATERREVLEAIRDVVLNLIGSREVALFELNPGEETLSPTYVSGLEAEELATLLVDEGLIGGVVGSGQIHHQDLDEPQARLAVEENLTAAIPLRHGDRVTGAIAVFRLLPQKEGALTPLDHELFNLLANQAGAALHRTGLLPASAGSYVH